MPEKVATSQFGEIDFSAETFGIEIIYSIIFSHPFHQGGSLHYRIFR